MSARNKTWRMKMEIPTPEGLLDSQLELALRQEVGWMECLKDAGISCDVIQSVPVSSEFDSIKEITFQVEELDSIASPLISAIRLFFSRVVRHQVVLCSKAALLFNGLEWFTPKLESAHLNNTLSSLHFGCMQGGTLLSHWEISFANEAELKDSELNVSFEYDRNTITVEFFNTENSRKIDAKTKLPQKVFYRLLIQNMMVRRIIVDMGTQERPRVRMHLMLNSPVVVKKAFCEEGKEMLDKIAPKRYTQIRRGRTTRDWSHELALADSPMFTMEFNDMTDPKLYHIISRLRSRCGVTVEFMHLDILSVPYGFPNPDQNPYYDGPPVYRQFPNGGRSVTYMGPTHPDDVIFRDFLLATFGDDESLRADRESVYYLIEALLSRGAIVKDQLLLQMEHWQLFLHTVSETYAISSTVCIEALERILTRIDEHKRIGSITKCLTSITEKLYSSHQRFGLTREQAEEGFKLVRKVVVTPTRVIRVAPEMVMGNRVLRRKKKVDEPQDELFDEAINTNDTEVIRVSFRDDDNKPMRVMNVSGALMDRTIRNAFRDGLFVAGRRYFFLGSSSSQMRDQGAHFMLGITDEDRISYRRDNPGKVQPEDYSIQRTIANMGKFLMLENVAKVMARLGQCFTQSRESKIGLYREDYQYTYDVTGGCDAQGSPYIFTDGVGSISRYFASEIAEEMKLNSVPSCFQFRFRGAKGVLAVDPLLDEMSDWAEENNLPPPEKVKDENQGSWALKCTFRQSQIKFQAKRYPLQPLEVVKFSGPTGVCLNKPFINILDQVSAKQSLACHKRVTNRIEELLDIQLQGLAQTLLSEKHARNKLSELPRRMDISLLSEQIGFHLVDEPFFRSLLKAAVKFQTTKQLRKEQIQVPFSKGRAMLGVTDQTDRLQYGQIFVQYTRNITEYSPPQDAAKIVLKGRVLVTKNPSVVGGDVRVFEAIDIPELRDLVDVIVFPKHGPRPHPDEMAGSDLDGDEYSVIWDPELLLDYNEEAASYQKTPAEKKEVSSMKMADELCQFFINYVKQDNVGVISNAHLFQSDLYGLDSKVCRSLAIKASQAVDFPKTGIPPERLRTAWQREDPEDEESEWLPPEKAERYPDFHFNNEYMPIYISYKLIGKLYREIKSIEDVLRMSEESDEHAELKIDEELAYPGWEEFEERAKESLENYNGRILNIMETYGIQSEGELFSGCICEMRNRISDKDQDDMSFYNTRHTIEERVNEVFREFRKDFFEEFGGWEQCTKVPDGQDIYEYNVFRRICHCANDAIRRKAAAYYMTCYQQSVRMGDRRLSFAWLASDVLADIKTKKAISNEEFGHFEAPLIQVMKGHVQEYLANYSERKEMIKLRMYQDDIILKYCTKYRDLGDLLFIVCEWADRLGLLQKSFQLMHMCYLVILFAVNHFVDNANAFGGVTRKYMDKVDPTVDVSELEAEVTSLDRPYEMLISFFGFMALRRFRKLEFLSFTPIGVRSVFLRGEWVELHKASVKTFYNLVFSMRFDDLPVTYTVPSHAISDREMEPFIIELPLKKESGEEWDLKMVENCLMKATKVTEVKLRRVPRKPGHVTVVCRGPLSACHKLRHLVAVQLNPHSTPTAKELSDQLAQFTIDNIMREYNDADHWEMKSEL